jgi:uncharacterized membrane protein YhiD involved in acid resistance
MQGKDNRMNKSGLQTILVVALLAALLGFAVVAYIFSDRRPADPVTQIQSTAQVAAPPGGQTAASSNTNAQSSQQQQQQPATSESDENFFSVMFGEEEALPGQVRRERWTIILPRIIVRLALAALLAGVLAFRPRKDLPMRQRNLYVAQTQILLAVVASALMMIVGDNAARAFGIFAAVSLVRFRTNIRDPKEVTVLLISLSIGLAAGVGRWDLALVLTLFVLPLLWLLESREGEEAFRSMELTVKTRDTNAMQEILQRVFQVHGFEAELRQLDPPDEDEPVGCIMYYVNMNLGVSTDQLSEEIRLADPKNVEAIEWDQKKGDSSYIYQ